MATTRLALELLARNKTARTLSGFNRQITGTTRTLRRLAGAAFAVGGAAGFGYMIKQQMAAIDSIAKMSDELKISTKALSAYEHAAKISGTTIETLHKGLEIFVRRLGEAKAGIGEGRRGLEMLGMKAQDLIDMGTEKSFEHVAIRISELKTAAEQAGAAYNFFGRQGVQLLNLFQQGEAGIKKLRMEADKLGITFSRIDAAKVEAANDALVRVRAVFTGLFRQATIELAPYIEAAAKAFTDWAISGEGAGAKVVTMFEQVSLAALEAAKGINGIPLALDKAKLKFMELQPYIKYTTGLAFAAPMAYKGSPTAEEKKALRTRIEAGEKAWAEKTRQLERRFEQLREGAAKAAPVTPERPQFGGMNLQTHRTLPSLEQRRSAPVLTPAHSPETVAYVEQYNAAEALKRTRAEAARTAAEAAQMAAFVDHSFQGAFRSMEYSMGSVFRRMRQEGESFGTTMENIAVNIGDAFLDMLGQIMVRQAMIAAVGGQGNFNSLMGIPAPVPSAKGNVFFGGRIQKAFASGGIVDKPTLFPMKDGTGLMGEEGAEGILPLERVGGKLGVNALVSGGSQAPPDVTVNIINQGQPLQQQGPPMVSDNVIDVMVENALAKSYDQGGLMRDITEGRRG